MKTKALISCAVTAQLICVFVFAYGKSRFSRDETHSMPSIKLVSRFCIKVLMNPISFLVFSKIILGSSHSHLRQFGAITMARLLTSILVTVAFSGAANT